MILTVTPNPALDYTIRLDEFEIGRRAKYRDPRIEPAGKGMDVSGWSTGSANRPSPSASPRANPETCFAGASTKKGSRTG